MRTNNKRNEQKKYTNQNYLLHILGIFSLIFCAASLQMQSEVLWFNPFACVACALEMGGCGGASDGGISLPPVVAENKFHTNLTR